LRARRAEDGDAARAEEGNVCSPELLEQLAGERASAAEERVEAVGTSAVNEPESSVAHAPLLLNDSM
jgi:hypothetical protein